MTQPITLRELCAQLRKQLAVGSTSALSDKLATIDAIEEHSDALYRVLVPAPRERSVTPLHVVPPVIDDAPAPVIVDVEVPA